ncbi:MAG: cupredoxin domain-containing protein [Solirubrobacterales bacterium]
MAIALAGLVILPSSASAAVETFTQRVGPVQVGGYEVKQSVLPAPHEEIDGYVTNMEVDVVNADGTPVPIQRLMLHHIVFANLNRQDATCDSIVGFDERPNSLFSSERFYAAGEERAKLALPPGYGYKLNADDFWGMLYMFMNHRPATDRAYIQYKYRVVSGAAAAGMRAVDPYWYDVENCRADPIYNVKGTQKKGSTDTESTDFVMPEDGYIVGGGGHVHGGARELTLTQPDCTGNRQIGDSQPTWGRRDHPFYNVKPVLHEPGPIAMSGFQSRSGIPVAEGERVRLNALYDNSLPHTRVMGIMVVYVDHSRDVGQRCAPLPTDTQTLLRPGSIDGRTGGPIPYTIPLTGLDEDGNAVTIRKPPGKAKRVKSGDTIDVGDRFFERPNVKLKRGGSLNWQFSGDELHNVTLANGPIGFGSPNLDAERTFSQRFTRSGTYRLFCALHPVQMSERVVVKGKKKRKRS